MTAAVQPWSALGTNILIVLVSFPPQEVIDKPPPRTSAPIVRALNIFLFFIEIFYLLNYLDISIIVT